MTREAVQVLARGAGQPSQLVKQLAACSGMPQLPGMVHLRERLAAEPEVPAQLVSNVLLAPCPVPTSPCPGRNPENEVGGPVSALGCIQVSTWAKKYSPP